MRSSYQPATPASLLFDNLIYDCKTDDARNAAIQKILAAAGGDDTVTSARDYARNKISGLDVTISQLKDKLDDLARKNISGLPVNVLTNHQLKLATSDKTQLAPVYTAALAALEHAIKSINKTPAAEAKNIGLRAAR